MRASVLSRAGAVRPPATENVLGWLLAAVLMVLIGLPLMFVLIQALAPGLGLGRDWHWQPELLGEILDRPLWQASLVNSLVLATGAMVVGGTFGTGLALIRHTVSFPGATLLDFAAWVLLVSPSFILAQGWVLFAAPSGVLSANLGLDISGLVFSPAGLIVVMSLTQYPLAYLATSAALRWDDRSYRYAAALAGARNATVLRTVRISLLTPAILSGAILVFVDVLGDFGLPAALSAAYDYPTLPYSIYASVRQSPVRFELGGVLSFYLVAIIGVAVVAYLRVLRRSRYDFLTATATPIAPPPAQRPWLWSGLTATVLFVTLVLPLGTSLQVSLSRTLHRGLSADNFTLDHYLAIASAGSSMLTAAGNSLTVAVCAAACTTVLGFGVAVVLTFTRFRARALIDLAATVSLAVPGIVLAVGYIFVWNQPALSSIGLNLYGRPVLLMMAATATALPIAVRLQLGALAQIPASFLAAAALSGAGLATRLRTVVLPLAAPAVISAFAAVLASSVFDLAATTMLAPPSFATLPVEILLAYDRGQYGSATAGAMVAAALVVVLAAFALWVGRRLMNREKAPA